MFCVAKRIERFEKATQNCQEQNKTRRNQSKSLTATTSDTKSSSYYVSLLGIVITERNQFAFSRSVRETEKRKNQQCTRKEKARGKRRCGQWKRRLLPQGMRTS